MNSETFKQRFLPLTRKLHWTAFSIMRNKQDAEDIVQEAFLKLWNKRHELEHVTNDEAYCVTLVKNLCLDAKRTSHTDLDAGPPEAMPLMAATDVESEVESRQQLSLFRQCIDELPEMQRNIITRRDIEDADFADIALETHITEANVRVILSRARKTVFNRFKTLLNHDNRISTTAV